MNISQFNDKFQNELSELFNKHKLFFAFSNEQLYKGLEKIGIENARERKDLNKIICKCLGGYLPRENSKQFLEDFLKASEENAKEKLKIFGIEAIIKYELYNRECFYTGNYNEVFELLNEDYEISIEKVKEVFYKELPNAEI